MRGKYDDMIHLKRPRSIKRLPMGIKNRAAQFAPFRALSGFSRSINEVGRKTCERENLSVFQREIINRKLVYILNNIEIKPQIRLKYFKEDEIKEGGSYIEIKARLLKYDPYKKILILEGDKKFNISDIYDVDSDILMDDIWF